MKKNELIQEITALLAEIDQTHRYSMSRIYGLYNRAFDAKEKPQSCASCLIRKARELKNWLDAQAVEESAEIPQVKKRTRKNVRK